MRTPPALFVFACFALVAGCAASACSSSDEEQTSTRASATTPASGGSPSASVSLEQDDFFFNPTEIAAQAGSPLTVTVKNNGKATHTFTIDALSVDETISPGSEKTVSLTPVSGGDLQFYCRFHKASNGMQGTLKVSGTGASSSSGAASPTATTSGGGYSGY